MATVSSLGVGSGIDLQSLVDGLVSDERQTRLTRLDVREGAATEKISAYGFLKSTVSEFNASITTLSSISTFQVRSAISSDTDAFSVSASLDAAVGTYAVDVLSEGTAQVLSRTSFVDVTNQAIVSADTQIGGGTLQIQQGSQPSFAVEITSAASSLNDIAAAINSADGNTGVEASVINADSGPVLVINAVEVGEDNAITITVSDVDGNDTDAIGLSQLTFDSLDLPGSNLTQTTGAANAQIQINGQTVTSSDGNVFADVVTGVTITALAQTTATGTASISKDTQKAAEAVDDFVERFNALVDSINELGRAGTESGVSSGALVGDSVLRNLNSQIRRTLFESIDDTQPEGARTLSDIGIRVDRDGKLSVDSSQLSDLLETNFDDVARLLAADGEPINQNQQFQSTAFANVSSVVTDSEFSIGDGENSFIVAISAGAGNNTLQAVRDAINNAGDNFGVTASIVLEDDGLGGTQARLLLTADTEGASLDITVTDTATSNAISFFTENVAATLDAPEGIVARIKNVITGFLGGGGEQGIIDARTQGLNRDVERINDERDRQLRLLDDFAARLTRQYASLDLLVANLQSSGDFLLSQLSSISQISNRSSTNT